MPPLSAYGRRCPETLTVNVHIPDTSALASKPPHHLIVDTARAWARSGVYCYCKTSSRNLYGGAGLVEPRC